MKKITVLITGGGAPGIAGTIYALRNNLDKHAVKIITTDVKDEVVGKYLADGFHKVPPPEHKDFIKTIMKIVMKEKVDVILPQATRELAIFAKYVKDFAKLNIAVVISQYESIRVANDKFSLLEIAKKIKIPCPLYFLTNSENSLRRAMNILGYPEKKVVVKPRVSNGMRGLRIITKDSWNVERFLRSKPEGIEIDLETLLKTLRNGVWPELLVMEYLAGDEYTVDMFKGRNGSVVIPRLRQVIRSGITFDAQIRLRKDIIEYSNNLADEMNLLYCFGFQFREDSNGRPKIIECNPRVQGTMVAGVFSGFNIIYNSVLEALGKKVKFDKTVLKEGINFIRYWGGAAVYGDKLIGKI